MNKTDKDKLKLIVQHRLHAIYPVITPFNNRISNIGIESPLLLTLFIENKDQLQNAIEYDPYGRYSVKEEVIQKSPLTDYLKDNFDMVKGGILYSDDSSFFPDSNELAILIAFYDSDEFLLTQDEILKKTEELYANYNENYPKMGKVDIGDIDLVNSLISLINKEIDILKSIHESCMD